MFIIGLLSTVVGNITIGIGQSLQKYALNEMEKEAHSSKELFVEKCATNDTQVSLLERFKSKTWISGALLSYIGELGNWFALSQVSPTIVTPVGIISVITNVLIAQHFLKEVLTDTQKKGYGLVLFAVLIILCLAPKGDDPFQSTTELFQFLISIRSFVLIFVLLFSQMVLVVMIQQGIRSIFCYVGICSLCGALTVSTSKVLTIYLRIVATNHASVDGKLILAFLCIIIASVLFQEVVKQKAITIFDVSKFHPLLYAGFNTTVVLSSVFYFMELPTLVENVIFISSFAICMLIIVKGISMTEQTVTKVVLPEMQEHRE